MNDEPDGTEGLGDPEDEEFAPGSPQGTGGEPEPSDSLRTFGAFVQGLREHHGLSRMELATHVRFSRHTVASVEVGRRMPDPVFIERAEPVLGDTGALRKAYKHLTRKHGLAAWFRRWAGMEGSALTLCTYECRLIPGLLQTEAYARTLFDDMLPPLDDNQIEAQWAARADRQQLLRERPNTVFSFILDEHIFLQRTGGVEVTRNLIDHILMTSAKRNIQVQVLPLGSGAHPGLNGPMVLLETPENQWFAYCEGHESGTFISDPKVVSVLHQRYAKLRSQALTPKASRDLLERMRGTL